MNKFACRFVVLQFVPYRETGEFANVGLVLLCPKSGYFGFRLQMRKRKRVTDFFDELPKEVYSRALQAMRTELERVARFIAAATPDSNRPELLRQTFDALAHPREAILRFGTQRAVLTDDPAAELDKQFDNYVDRAFATPEYLEHTIERRVKSLLGRLDLALPFRAERLGNDQINVRFPFVQHRGAHVAKVIKPFNLTQKDPTAIYEHGDVWLQKVKRLKARSFLPDDVLFAVAGPPVEDEKRRTAFTEICQDLQSQGVFVVNEGDEAQIAAFATNTVPR